MKYAIGMDIGGTTIACGIINEAGDLIQQEIVPSDPSDREKMFERVVACVQQLMDHCSIPFNQITGIGAGVPGKIDRDNGIAVFQNNLPWENFPFVERIREALGIRKVVIDNDVYMAAFAEWKDAGLDEGLFVYMTISTGISTAIIQNGEFIRGAGFAGELGLVPVTSPNETIGHSHTEEHSVFGSAVTRLEKTSAGPALERHAQALFHSTDMTAEKLFQLYYQGDEKAITLVNGAIDSWTHGIYMINSMLDPHKIVFGGSVATHNPVLLQKIKEKLDALLIDEQKHILNELCISRLGNNQGIIGAGLRALAED